jgi:hypothetical protein
VINAILINNRQPTKTATEKSAYHCYESAPVLFRKALLNLGCLRQKQNDSYLSKWAMVTISPPT